MKWFTLLLFLFLVLKLNGQTTLDIDSLTLTKGVQIKYESPKTIKKIQKIYINFFAKKSISQKFNLIDYGIDKSKFDKNGNLLEYKSKHKINDFKWDLNGIYSYYKNDYLRKIIISKKGKIIRNEKVTQTIKSDSLITTYRNENDSIIYQEYQIFNTNFHIIESGKINDFNKTFFYYDKKNRLEKEVYFSNDTLFDNSFEKKYFYDDKDRLISTIFISKQVTDEWSFELNDNGLLIREKNHRIIEKEELNQTFEYTYNKNGNWIRRKNVEAGTITRRKIRYY